MQKETLEFLSITKENFIKDNSHSKFIYNQFGKSQSSDLAVFFATITPGEYIPPHIHPAPNDTYIYIISGHVRHYFGDFLNNHIDNGANDIIHIPANMPHQPTNLSTTELVCALVFCNYDQNDFYTAAPYNHETNTILWDQRGVNLETWEHIQHIGPSFKTGSVTNGKG